MGYRSFHLYVIASGSHPKWVVIKSCCTTRPSVLCMEQTEGLTLPACTPSPQLTPRQPALVTQPQGPQGQPGVPVPTTSLLGVCASCRRELHLLGLWQWGCQKRMCTTRLHCSQCQSLVGAGGEIQKHTSAWMGLQAAMCGRPSFFSPVQAIPPLTLLIRQKLLTGQGRRKSSNLLVNASTNYNYDQTSGKVLG